MLGLAGGLACAAILTSGATADQAQGPSVRATEAVPEQITLKGGQTVTTKTVFKRELKYTVQITGALTTPLGSGGDYVVDAFYGQQPGRAPTRDGALTGKAGGYNDTLDRFTTTRTPPAFNAAHTYTIVLDAVENGTMELTARAYTGELKITITPPGAATGGDKVTLSKVSRKVEVSRNEGNWENAANSMKLASGDRIHTGFKAGVTLTFPDGSRLHVDGMTMLELTELSRGPAGGVKVRLWLRLGEVTGEVNRSSGAAGDYNIKTPTSTASIRGTKFSVAHDGTATTVAVTESTVEVTANNGASVVVSAGLETRATAAGLTPPVAIGAGFKSGGLSSAQALARMESKIASGLRRCKLTVVSSRLTPAAGGWRGRFVVVRAGQGIDDKPTGTAQFGLKGTKVSGRNALAKRITRGCR
ncbi:FecR family protein [Svornostia abyssi]|uniref:FecR family protein n=1 Tax=Svornostia abyssi TaxID=2898438 RepID=A0ABY5PCX8_9ACTN|nr:FecR family protein [Parviterribacteraceae bacterium J379]